MSIATLSNEARILRALNQLSCPISNFCKLADIPRTRFEQALRGEPGRALSDLDAQKYLDFIERLFNLQIAVDETVKAHIPLDWSKVNQIGDALVVHQAQKICVEDGDHTLDAALQNAAKSVAASQ